MPESKEKSDDRQDQGKRVTEEVITQVELTLKISNEKVKKQRLPSIH